MDLQDIREQIDAIDRELVSCLEKRMDLVSQVAAYKKATGKAVLDPEREQLLLQRIAALVANEAYRPAILATFADILKHSRDYQIKALGEDADGSLS
ncbi:chorismate mutase [Streptococcus ratti]|uniref:Chorismate mutase n=1 Tax=Streptococcus ratti TaxID=1341 RepID=A0A7X9LEX1_STRRT|nr:chorismate mutase [Streptococcus ratti]NMD49936.1 chorismate mutase [Streptococcus ratti]